MDIVNYTDGSGGCDDPPAGPMMSAERRIKVCPLCDALNGPSPQGCSNCGWRDSFYGDAAGVRSVWLRLRSGVFLMSWKWRNLTARLHTAHGWQLPQEKSRMG